MPALEQRVAYLEGRTEDHTAATADLRQDMRELRQDMRELGEAMVKRLTSLDEKVDRHFTWLVGIQMATLVAIVGALVGVYY